MNITKLPQSGLILQKDGQRIAFDPANLPSAPLDLSSLGQLNAVIYTHSHPDHLDIDVARQLAASGATLYGNADVVLKLGDIPVETVEPGNTYEVAGFELETYDLPHCLAASGQPVGIPNTGFLVDGAVLLPGDSTDHIGRDAEIIALPIFGPDISFKDAIACARVHNAAKVIPVHSDIVGMKPQAFTRFAKMSDEQFEVLELEAGGAIEL